MAAITMNRTRTLWSIPGLRQLALLIGLAAAVAAGFSVFTWSQKPGMAPIYTNLSTKDASDVADALRAANIPYQVDAASGVVAVAAGQVNDARLKLAGQGLPKGSSMGFEMIQQEQGFGTSQFIESARYQHALEIELGRTVSSLQSVQNARVHLALPKPSAFSRGTDQASASVLVELHPGRNLDNSQVASIVHLVASSVPNLAPAAVTVIDQFGRLLTKSGDDSDAAARDEQFEQTRRLEADYVRRIEDLLAPLTGPGRVSAQVVADMDYTVSEEASESYKPDPAAIRSEQTSEDSNKASASPQGVPGAVSNQPPGNTAAAPLNTQTAADSVGSNSKHSTRNYELGKTLSHTRRPGGIVRHLSVAVLVDYLPKSDGKIPAASAPLDAEELKKVDSLVRQAVGFDDKRGDTLSVQNAPFFSETLPVEAEPPLWQRADVRDYARQGLGAITLLVLIFAVLRPVLRWLVQPVPEAPMLLAAADAPAGALAQPDRLSLAAPSGGGSRPLPAYDEKLALARGAVTQDPKRVAQVVKTWIGEDG